MEKIGIGNARCNSPFIKAFAAFHDRYVREKGHKPDFETQQVLNCTYSVFEAYCILGMSMVRLDRLTTVCVGFQERISKTAVEQLQAESIRAVA